MINIYCLIDPRNNKPFYVGATNCKISVRLSGHVSEVRTYLPKYWNTKQKFINEILQAGKKPRIRLLFVATLQTVNHYEQFFYLMFIKQGFNLIQLSSSFYYKERMITLNSLKTEYKQLRKYMQLRYNNILIFIW